MTIRETPVLIERTRLQELFSFYKDQCVMFLSAGMGSGKTKAVEQWLDTETKARKIWFTFPEDTDDEQWVWFRLCQAFKESNETLITKLESNRLPRTTKEIADFITIMTDYKAENIFTYLILDDFQECKSEAIKKVIKALCYQQINNVCIIFISREKPDAFFYEMQLKGACNFMNQTDFDFTSQEIEDLWNLNAKRITKDKHSLINQYTEGWTASVYLMLLYDWDNEFPLHLKNIEILLRDHVYDKLSEQWQVMLKKLALLESFSKIQAVEIIQDDAVVELIDYLERNNCFIHYNDSEKIYHLHTILRETLTDMVAADQQFCQSVWNLAGAYFERNNDEIDALKYFGYAKNDAAILDLMAKQGATEYMDIAPSLITLLFDRMPIDVARLNPLGYITYISSYSISVDGIKGKSLLQKFKTYALQHHLLDDPFVQGELLLAESVVNFNQIDVMCELQKKAEEFLGERGSVIQGQQMDFLMGSPNVLYLYYRSRESLQKLMSTVISSSNHFVKLTHGCGSGCDKLAQAQMLLWQGQFQNQNIERLLDESEIAAHEYGQISIIIAIVHTRLKKAAILGDRETMKRELRKFHELTTVQKQPSQETSIDLSLGFHAVLTGNFDNVPEWIVKEQFDYYQTSLASSTVAFIICGFVLLHEQRYLKLAELVETMKDYGKMASLYTLQIYAQIFSSVLVDNSRKEEVLLQALDMALPDSYWLPFIELSPYILKTLKKITRKKELLQLCEAYCKVFENQAVSVEKVKLSQREKEIMQFLCSGYTRIMIAEKLCISQYTVKRHISNIYEKLQVESKAEAIKKMRAEL